MLIIGLTGSIGMGKSTIAGMFRSRGLEVFDADQEVHRLYASEAVPLVEAAFPGTTANGKVDRPRLAAALGSDAAKFRILERIVHPLVRKGEAAFLRDAKNRGDSAAILEIPLLLEAGLEDQVDAVVVVSAPASLQRARVLERPGMTEQRMDALVSRQMQDAEKRAKADFVVDTGGTLADSEAKVDAILTALKGRSARAFARHWNPA